MKGGIFLGNANEYSKGIAIVLVVFGHNSIFQGYYKSLIDVIYNFHVMYFLVALTTVAWGGAGKHIDRIFRYAFPYSLMCVLLFVLYSFFGGEGGVECGYVPFFGGVAELRECFGFGYLWFVPVAIYVLTLSPIFKALGLLVSLLVSFLLFWLSYVSGVLEVGFLVQALSVFWIGICVSFVTRWAGRDVLSLPGVVVFTLFCLSSYFAYVDGLKLNFGEGQISGEGGLLLLNVISGVCTIDMLGVIFARYLRFEFICFLGRYSFYIYLSHSVVMYALNALLPRSEVFGWVSFFGVFLILYGMWVVMRRINVYRWLFPEGLGQYRLLRSGG